jgi:hypothetical protein
VNFLVPETGSKVLRSCNWQSALLQSAASGGIAQLVERQLCKLEVRGSNPLASSLRSQRSGERRLSRRSFSEERTLFTLQRQRSELWLGKPMSEEWQNSFTSTF